MGNDVESYVFKESCKFVQFYRYSENTHCGEFLIIFLLDLYKIYQISFKYNLKYVTFPHLSKITWYVILKVTKITYKQINI